MIPHGINRDISFLSLISSLSSLAAAPKPKVDTLGLQYTSVDFVVWEVGFGAEVL